MHERTWSRLEQAQRVRERIWQFISPAATRQGEVLPLASALLQLPRQDTRFLSALHLLLAPETTEMLDRAPALLRQLTTSTTAALEEHPERVRGPIDWPATLAASTGRGRRYATRPPERDYATAENRLLVASLRAVRDAAHTLGWEAAASGASQETTAAAGRALVLLGSPVLRAVPSQVHARDLQRVEKGRAARRFQDVTAFWRLHDRLGRLHDLYLLREMVESTALLASTDEALLEVLVLLDLLDALRARGWERSRLVLIRGQAAIAHTRGGQRLTVHYQGAPRGLPSRYNRTLRQHGLGTPGLRPDVVLDHRGADGARTITVIEVKLRRSPSAATRAALFDLLAYKDSLQGLEADLRLAGITWGSGLAPNPHADVMLCTTDHIADLVRVLDELTSSPATS